MDAGWEKGLFSLSRPGYTRYNPVYLRLLDLATGEVTKFPGSEGLHSPRVSPDGSTLAALRLFDGHEMLRVSFLRPWVEDAAAYLAQLS